jgi:2-dehydropantoate 2-reductase
VKLLVLGAGGIGGYFGGRLAEAGVDTTFLVRPGRRAQLQRDGLRIESVLGNAQLPVNTVLAEDVRPEYDVVLLTCKAYDLESAIEAIAPAMDGRAAVVPMLNGMSHVDRLDERFGRAHVIGGTCQINVHLAKDGVIHHNDPLQRLTFGERDAASAERAQQLAGALAKTKLDWKQSKNIELDLWEKIVFLSALAATTCLFRGNVGEIIAAPGGRETMERALAANVETATRAGFTPRPALIEGATKRLTDPQGTWSASMLRDLEAGGPVEADHVIGWMLDEARKHGANDTVLSLAYTHLKTYEARRRLRPVKLSDPVLQG